MPLQPLTITSLSRVLKVPTTQRITRQRRTNRTTDPIRKLRSQSTSPNIIQIHVQTNQRIFQIHTEHGIITITTINRMISLIRIIRRNITHTNTLIHLNRRRTTRTHILHSSTITRPTSPSTTIQHQTRIINHRIKLPINPLSLIASIILITRNQRTINLRPSVNLLISPARERTNRHLLITIRLSITINIPMRNTLSLLHLPRLQHSKVAPILITRITRLTNTKVAHSQQVPNQVTLTIQPSSRGQIIRLTQTNIRKYSQPPRPRHVTIQHTISSLRTISASRIIKLQFQRIQTQLTRHRVRNNIYNQCPSDHTPHSSARTRNTNSHSSRR